ncbi:MAG: HDOD domain-containing protein [Burkholderiales bacterium]|nr:HDOD domain-containing protein [Burkholderiales bacterium]
MSASASDSPPRAGAPRYFGRLQLLRLLGKSQHTMSWLVAERDGHELMLVLPRVAPQAGPALERWHQAVRRAARLAHPQLAPAVDTGVQDGWPYVAYDMTGRATLADRLTKKGLPGPEAAALVAQMLQGLAYAHDAGVVHGDLQLSMCLVDEQGQARLAGLEVACESPAAQALAASAAGHAAGSQLSTQRAAAERDVLALGLLLHSLIAGTPALEEADIGRALVRLPPLGREIVRLPWAGMHPVAEPLRAIVNRATDRQERQRYRNARTLLLALEGWLKTESATDGGVLGLLADKLRAAGVLPALPGAGARAARLALMERERTNELAEVVLEDLALSFELLRAVNTAQVRGAQVSGSGPVLTVRRAIAMIGLDGVRRAALGLRSWPGPLDETGAAELERLAERCKRAGRIAMALRLPVYDGEVVYLITLLQNLGRLVVQYHFADEAVQIRRLMQPGAPARDGEPPEPGMSEEGAAYAVLGADIDALGQAVARWWGLEESVLGMIRRLPPTATVHTPESDDDTLRLIASCANEVVDATALPAAKVLPALQRVVQRYGRLLDLTLRGLQEALHEPSQARIAQTAPMPLDIGGGSPVTRSASPGSLRAAAALRSTRTPGAPGASR